MTHVWSLFVKLGLERSLVLARIQAAKKGVALDVAVESSLSEIAVDGDKIEQAMSNVLGNAIEHSLTGAAVSVQLKEVGNSLIFSVRDHGVGMSQEAMKHLFTPFRTTTAVKTGGEKSTGLGMTITRKTIEAHQGKITAESHEGSGTRFTITLNTKNNTGYSDIRILVVDDDPDHHKKSIVMMSGKKRSSNDQADGLDAGADGYIARPVSNRELLSRVTLIIRLIRAERKNNAYISELELAMKRIKVLSGIVPICMHCKQIRDDEGYWNQLESYISKHSDTQLSHCICDACLEKHYPEDD